MDLMMNYLNFKPNSKLATQPLLFRQLRNSVSAIAIMLSLSVTLPATAETNTSETIATTTAIGVAPPTCESQTQIALNKCAARWARTADFMRSLIYEEFYIRMETRERSQLLTTEQAWNTFRELHCQAVSEPYRTGSIYALLYHSCRAMVTNDRIADLQGLGRYAPVSAEADARLNELLDDADFRQSTSEQAWTRYQKLHCDFEVMRFSESWRSEDCNLRLAESHIHQLIYMLGTR
jgi:uncharacterized protein YecT (DUF1311 family)